MAHDQPVHVAFLFGKPLRVDAIIAEVIQRLHRIVPLISVYKPERGQRMPPLLSGRDLVVQRGLHADALVRVIDMESTGGWCINSAVATRSLRSLANRATVMTVLCDAGIPVPQSVSVCSWKEVIELTNKRPSAVKGLDGGTGRGLNVLVSPDGHLPEVAPFDGPFLVQEYIASNATVRKVYVVGRPTRGLLKPAETPHSIQDPSVPDEIDPAIGRLARLAGAALGVEIYGVDVLAALDGPKIIDVNPFPGFRNVPDAARLIANHLSNAARMPEQD